MSERKWLKWKKKKESTIKSTKKENENIGTKQIC